MEECSAHSPDLLRYLDITEYFLFFIHQRLYDVDMFGLSLLIHESLIDYNRAGTKVWCQCKILSCHVLSIFYRFWDTAMNL